MRRTPSSGPFRPRRRRTMQSLVAIISLTVLLLGPLMTTITLAQDGEQDPAQDLVAQETGDPTEEPVEIPTDVPSQDPTAVATDVPTQVPTQVPTEAPAATEVPEMTAAPGPELSDILNYIRICPAGYEPATMGWSDFLADCPDPGAGFTISVTAPGAPWFAETSDAGGMVTFTNIPVGPVELSQQPRDGFGEPYVFCSVEGSDAPQPVSTPGSAFDYEVRANPDAPDGGASGEACFWFNIPLDTDNGGTLSKYTCPEGFDATGASLEDFLATCEAPGAGITLSITGEGYAVEEVTDPAGMVALADLPPGTISITEQTEDVQYDLYVFCEETPGVFAPVTTSGATAGEVVVPDDFEVTCYLFNVPVEPDLTIEKYYCPEDLDLTGQPLDVLLETCTEDGPAVDFTAAGDGVALRRKAVPGGMASFAGLPAGQVTITEDVPAGYGDPVVYCEIDEGAFALAPNTRGASTIDVDPTFPTIRCFWFNIPDEPDITIQKYYCPPGHDAEAATLDDLLADCSDPGEDVTFTIAGEGYAEEATTDERGVATFPDVPVGVTSLTEQGVPGFEDEVWMYCQWADATASFVGGMITQGEPGQIEFTGSDLFCYVFNVPAESSEVVVIKYLCPPGVELNGSGPGGEPAVEDYLDACPDRAAGIGFAMSNPAYEERSQTDGDGAVTFSDVPPGRFQLEEDLPQGYGDPVVFCGWTTDDGAVLPVRMPTYRTFLDAEMPGPGVSYVCHWFNISLEDATTDVTFVKHLCPAGIDVAGATLATLLADCAEPGVGVGFAFSTDGYESIQETDDTGVVTFRAEMGSRFTVEEDPQDGYDASVVFCGWTLVSGGTEIVVSPVEVPVYGWNLDLELPGPGSVITCDWFNIAEEDRAAFMARAIPPPGTGQLDITTWSCPAHLDAATDPATLAAECATMPGVLYYLASLGPIAAPQQLSDSNGVASWTQVPGGSWTIYQATPQGHDPEYAAWCRYLSWPEDATDVDGAEFQPPAGPAITSFAGAFAYEPLHLSCDVYTFQQDVVTETPTETGQIDMHVVTCPAGYTFENFDITMLGDCLPGETGAEFHAGDGGSYSEFPPASDASWRVFFDTVPLDTPVTITRNSASGEGAPYATCDQGTGVLNVVPADNGIATVVESPSAGTAVERCIWFTVRSDAPAAVTIEKDICPAGVIDPATATYDDLLLACGTAGTGTTFHIYDVNVAGPVLLDETDENGLLAWEGEAGERFSVVEEVPDGYGAPVVYCTYGSAAAPDTTWAIQPTLYGNQILSAFPLAPGYTWACHWFNIEVEAGATEVPDATERPGDGAGVGRVLVEKHVCPSGLEVGDPLTLPDLTTLSVTCPAFHDGVAITVSDGEEYDEEVVTGTSTDGGAAFFDVPAGTIHIDEEIPAGFGEPMVFCHVDDGSGGTAYAPMTPVDGGFDYTVRADMNNTCLWFNVIDESGGTGDIFFDAWLCPAGYTAGAFDLDTLLDDCDAPHEGLTLTVRDAWYFTERATTDAAGAALVTGIPTEVPLFLSDDSGGAFAETIVACSAGELGYQPIQPVNGEYPYVDFSTERCSWFSIPLAAGATEVPTDIPTETPPTEVPADVPTEVPGTETPTETPTGEPTVVTNEVPDGDATIRITKHACPDGFAAYEATADEVRDACTEHQGAVDFTVINGDYNETDATSGGDPNSVEFTGVPEGDTTIAESIPPGHGAPIVFCTVLEPGAETPVDYGQVTLNGGTTLSWTVDPGIVISCDWYNVPLVGDGDGEGQVIVHKYGCPEGFDPAGLGLDEMIEGCTEDAGEVTFILTNGAFSATHATAPISADAPNGFGSGLVPAGTMTITETIPDGYGEPVVFCSVEDPATVFKPVARMPVVDGTSITETFAAGQYLLCSWFNRHEVPDAPGMATVSFIKHTCPEGIAPGEDESFYLDACPPGPEGIGVRLTGATGDRLGTTGADGAYTWFEVPPGAASIQEVIPEGYGEPEVFCGYTYTERTRHEASGGHIAFDIPEPGDWICLVYNIPAGDGEIVVEKHTCPPGYDLHAHGADPAEDCADATSGVTFHLGGPATERSGMTGGSGAVTFGDLEPGRYTITESVPDGTWYSFVLDCTGERMGELRPSPLAMGETVQVDVAAGERITCRWYNVPPDAPGAGRLTVIAYTCATLEFVTDVDCQIDESGAGFDLVWWNGDAWAWADEGTTDGVGRLTFTALAAGEYWVDDQEGQWCHMTSDGLSDDGNWLNVRAGEETAVHVYSCASDSGEQGKPGPIPAKYPNTGVPPGSSRPALDRP